MTRRRWTMVGVVLVSVFPALVSAQQTATPPESITVVMSFRFFAAYYGGMLVAAFDSKRPRRRVPCSAS